MVSARALLSPKKRLVSTVIRHFLSTGPPWRVLFYGTDDFALKSLQQLHQNQTTVDATQMKLVDTLEVVCTERPLPVRRYALAQSLPIHTWPYDVPSGVYDIGIIVSFGHLIPESSIQAIRHGMINVHGSLLPRWRGAAPIPHSILNDDKETGITIMEVAPHKFDVGRIVVQKSCTVPEGATTAQLLNLLSDVGAQLLLQCLCDLENNLNRAYAQLKQGITMAPKITVQMAIVDWSKHDSHRVDRMYRALGHVFELRTTWYGTGIKLFNMVSPEETLNAGIDSLIEFPVPAGWCFFHKQHKILCIRCCTGWVAFRHVLVFGKKVMTARDFQNGYLAKVSHKMFGT